MNALNVIETAQEHWDEDTVTDRGFDAYPGDAVLHHSSSEDEDDEYRIVQFLDIVQPTGTPGATRALIAEYVAVETDAGATYEITTEADTASVPPETVNSLISDGHSKHLYHLERTGIETFQITVP
jgi:hypothetical protein